VIDLAGIAPASSATLRVANDHRAVSRRSAGCPAALHRPGGRVPRPRPVGGHVDDRWTTVHSRGITTAALWTSCWWSKFPQS